MVEFRFDIRPLFAQPIVKVTSNLLPHTFRGDRRQALDATSKMSEIIDRLGQLSATSQKLNKPVTTAQKLRMSDNQILYLLGDVEAGNNGSVIGLLKVGTKDLYLFDETGQTRKIENTPCILDFYIHESRQRAGLGKDMFETMLGEEHWTPLKCSVDRPSEKLLGFLKKHYGLVRTIPQANNFVLYEGFFDRADNGAAANEKHTNGMHITTSPNTQLFGAHYVGDETHKRRMRQQDAPNAAAQITQISPVGRYGARRPTCSMAEIIHSNSTPKKGGPESSSLNSPISALPVVEALAIDLQDLHTNDLDEATSIAEAAELAAEAAEMALTTPELEAAVEKQLEISSPRDEQTQRSASVAETGNGDNFMNMKKPATFQLSKQHTGMKNMSFGVGMAVTPTNKMEFDQEAREEFGVVKINRPIGSKLNSPSTPAPDHTDAISTISSGEGLTDQGYYDLKFYHNKLW